ncbi:hypothetical protein OG21DRAFT_510452 [Imleria badia]|nr:hypothetical protein OG21DRAFT_510452 [Imleria badia]
MESCQFSIATSLMSRDAGATGAANTVFAKRFHDHVDQRQHHPLSVTQTERIPTCTCPHPI